MAGAGLIFCGAARWPVSGGPAVGGPHEGSGYVIRRPNALGSKPINLTGFDVQQSLRIPYFGMVGSHAKLARLFCEHIAADEIRVRRASGM